MVHFCNALDLKMGQYTIKYDPYAQKICTIISWGEIYLSLRLLMGIVGFPGIFQAKISELMAILEFVRVYIDDILCISNGSLKDHLNKLKHILTKIQAWKLMSTNVIPVL